MDYLVGLSDLEDRSRFFDAACEFLKGLSIWGILRNPRKLYREYADVIRAHKKLDVDDRLADPQIIKVFDGIDAAIEEYFPNDRIFCEIYRNAGERQKGVRKCPIEVSA